MENNTEVSRDEMIAMMEMWEAERMREEAEWWAKEGEREAKRLSDHNAWTEAEAERLRPLRTLGAQFPELAELSEDVA